MKRYNDIVIVGIDHGYGNIKTANTVTQTGINKLDAEPTYHTKRYQIRLNCMTPMEYHEAYAA